MDIDKPEPGDFNTSYVTVQLRAAQNENSGNLDFNTSYVTVQPRSYKKDGASYIRFQYILCYGSTLKCAGNRKVPCISIHLMLRFNLLEWLGLCLILNFNTSYVTVQP